MNFLFFTEISQLPFGKVLKIFFFLNLHTGLNRVFCGQFKELNIQSTSLIYMLPQDNVASLFLSLLSKQPCPTSLKKVELVRMFWETSHPESQWLKTQMFISHLCCAFNQRRFGFLYHVASLLNTGIHWTIGCQGWQKEKRTLEHFAIALNALT